MITSPGVGGKMDGQRSGERQMHFKVTQPLEPFRRAEIRAGRVIAHRAPVVGNKAERRLLRGIVRHLLVVRIGEGVGVDPREVGDIEKAFDWRPANPFTSKAGQLIC